MNLRIQGPCLKFCPKVRAENLILFSQNENRITTALEKDFLKIHSAVLICAIALFAFFWAAPYRKTRTRKRDIAPAVAVQVKGDVTESGIYIVDGSAATVAALAAKAGARHKIPEAVAHMKLISGQSLEIVRGKSGEAIKLGRMPGAALLACGLKLDINSAPLDDLLLVPHLRPGIAAAIVKRRSRRSWANVNDLLEIRGVGPKTIQRLRDYLEVSGGEAPASHR